MWREDGWSSHRVQRGEFAPQFRPQAWVGNGAATAKTVGIASHLPARSAGLLWTSRGPQLARWGTRLISHASPICLYVLCGSSTTPKDVALKRSNISLFWSCRSGDDPTPRTHSAQQRIKLLTVLFFLHKKPICLLNKTFSRWSPAPDRLPRRGEGQYYDCCFWRFYTTFQKQQSMMVTTDYRIWAYDAKFMETAETFRRDPPGFLLSFILRDSDPASLV